MEKVLLQLFIFFGAAVIAVPLAKKMKLGSVLGYLIAGIVVGPFGFSLIGDIESVMHFTEFGVVMLLFLVGLELKPSLLWQMRTPIIGTGGTQVLLTGGVVIGVAQFFLPWQQALATGLILSLSSTAIVLQTLREKGLMNTPQGRSVFSVLLFQDLAVIPMIALLPLLATLPIQASDPHGATLFDITTLPTYLRLFAVFLAIALIYFIGKYASRPLFRAIAATRIREVFVAAALALVIGISLLMMAVGLSPALGTFIAGVVLADSEYRHELESDIEPFKGLLLGVFFIAIGASLNLSLIAKNSWVIGGLVIGLIAVKALVLYITARLFGLQKSERILFSVFLAQGGEFAFVLFQIAKLNGVLTTFTTEILVSVVALSMFLAPILFLLYDKIIFRFLTVAENEKIPDTIEHKGGVILAGFGSMGTNIGRLLISAGIKPTILDYDETNVDILRRFGFEVYYGDATRHDLLESAGAEEAKLIIITLGNLEKSVELVELVQKHYPNLKIAVNAPNRAAVYTFMDLGVQTIRRETFGSALLLGEDALKLIGIDPHEAYKLMRLFRKKDEEALPQLYKIHREDNENYISTYRQHHNDLVELIKRDRELEMEELDRTWSSFIPADIGSTEIE